MTLLDEAPAATMPSTSSEPFTRSAVPAWRFASRLARREVRRRPGRTALAALLIAVPVAAMTTGSIIARTNATDWTADFQRDYGDTDIVVNPSAFGFSTSEGTPEDQLTPLPTGATSREYLWVGTGLTSPVEFEGNKVWYAQFGNMPFTDTAATAGIKVTDGRAPEVGEVLLGKGIARRFGVGVGDQLTLTRPSGSWLVAGLGEIRGSYYSDPLIIPGFDAARFSSDYGQSMTLIDVAEGTPIDDVRQIAAERGGVTRYDDPYFDADDLNTGIAWGFVAGVLALVAVGIVVAAAFATSARRQFVTIGQLSANGASEGVVRRTLALQGTWTGVGGVIIGMAAGLALLPVTTPLIARHIVNHEIRAYRFSITDLVVIAVTAIVAATVAAAVPARSAARAPVMAALAGRRPSGSPARWLVPTGLVLLVGGLGVVAVAALGAKGVSRSSNVWAALVVIGATSMVFGTCCAAPLVIEKVGAFGRRSSLSWRLALRSLVRSRTRSSAVVTAIAVAVGAATAVAAVAESAMQSNRGCCPPSMPVDAIVIYGVPTLSVASDSGDLIDYGPLTDIEVPADVFAAIEVIAPTAQIAPYEITTFDPAPYDSLNDYNDPAGPLVATPAVLDLLGLSKADRSRLEEIGALQPTSVAAFEGHNGYVSDEPISPISQSVVAEYRAEGGVIEVPFVLAADPVRHVWDGQILISEQAAVDVGFTIVSTGVIIRAGEPFTPAQLDQIAGLQQQIQGSSIDAFIEPGDPPRTQETDQPGALNQTYFEIRYDDPRWTQQSGGDLWIARLVIVGGALAVTVLVVSIGLALAAADGREERSTFMIVGARPSSMRREAAARAAVLALVGIGLGIPLGYLPTWVIDRVANTPYDFNAVPVRPPWLVLGALLVIIPLVASGAAWAASGTAQRFRPATPSRRD